MKLPTLLLALFTCGCLVAPHSDFSTPPDAVLTFQSSFARDDVVGELGCFSQRFRAQNGVSLQAYATVRDHFLEPLGGLGRFVLRRDSLDDNLLGLEARDDRGGETRVRLIYSLACHAFEVDAVPEATFRFPDPLTGRTASVPLWRDSAALERRRSATPDVLVVEIQLPAEVARQLVTNGLPWAEVANEWKLEHIEPLEEAPEVAPPPPDAIGEARTLRVPSIPVRELRTSFGAVHLRIELPLDDASGCIRTLSDGTILVATPRATADPAAPAKRLDRLRWEATASAAR